MIDLKTIAFCIVLINIFLCAALLIVWRVQKVYAGFGYWVLANAGLALGHIFLFLLRDIIPFSLSVLMNNLCFLLAAWLRLEGLRRFFGRKGRWYPHLILIFSVSVVFWIFPFTMGIRSAMISGCLAIYLFWMTAVLFAQTRGRVREFYWYLSAVFLIYGSLLVSRFIIAVIAPYLIATPRATTANLLFFPAAMLLDIGISLGLLLLNDKRVATELREKEAQLRLTIEEREGLLQEVQSLLDSTGEGIYGVDTEGRCTFINKSGAGMIGFSHDEIIGKDMHALIHHSHPDGSVYDVQECPMNYTFSEGRKISSDDEILWRKDGTFFPAAYSSFPVVEGNHIKGAVVTFSDITERKRMEKDLKQSEENYRSLVETQTDLISRFNPDGTFVYVNEAYCRFFEKSPDELVGKKWQPLPVDEDVSPIEEELLTLSPATPTVIIENRLRSGKGNIHWMQFVNRGFFDPQGHLVEIQSVGRDITERKQAEEALQQSEDKFRLIFRDSPDAISIHSLEDGLYVDINQAFTDLTGFTKEEVIGPTGIEKAIWHDPADRERLAQGLRERGHYENMEAQFRRKDGSLRIGLLSARVVKLGGIPHIISITRDISERKRAEEEIRKLNEELEQRVRDRTAQLEAANRELESFSYSVSHDLRTPLRSIDGFSLALLEDCADKLDEKGKGYLERIRKATQKMGFLIDDLLELSRVSRHALQEETVDLSRMARAIAETLRQSHPDRPIEMIIQEDLAVQGDRHLLEIAMDNLLDNAWKFTAQTESARIEFGRSLVDGKTAYFIKDNGVGFDMTYGDKLFSPFQRLYATQDFPGTGIGLATVKRIITRHGGQVWAEGEVGKGAAFYFTLGQNA